MILPGNKITARDTRGIWAIGLINALLSFYYGNWSACLPWVELNRDMDNATFGNYLSVAIVGALVAMPLLPVIQESFGSALLTLLGFISLGTGFTVLCIEASATLFVIGMILNGFATIIVFHAVIAQAAVLEKRVQQQWMGTFSAISGIGGLIGGLIGGALLEYTSMTVWVEMLACTVFASGSVIICYPFLYHKEEEDASVDNHNSAKENNNLFSDILPWLHNDLSIYMDAKEEETTPIMGGKAIAYKRDWLGMGMLLVIASISFMVEASIGDWSSIYLIEHWDCGYLIGILGYAAQKVATIISGWQCDYIVERFSKFKVFQVSVGLIVLGFFLSFAAYLMPVTNLSLFIAILGFTVGGYGAGWALPLWYSISGAGIRGFTVAETSAIVMTASNCFYFVSPLMFGNFASLTGDISYSYLGEAVISVSMAVAAYYMPSHYFQAHKSETSDL